MNSETMEIGTATYGNPAPSRRDPAKARQARTRGKQERWASEMRAAGWVVIAPEQAPIALAALVRMDAA
jgi:hypothetical protein